MDERREELIKQWRSKNDQLARQALDEIRRQGWLTDGSLAGVSLYGAHLAGTDLRRARLPRAILSGIDLIGADLRGADFSGADMIDSNLSGANLTNAVFRGTDLIAAKLSGANLTNTDLTDAALGGTKLNYAVFHHTVLTHANFNNAICDNTLFVDVDLSDARELQTIRHFGPSDVGIRTLFKSGGQIPEEFLRGCGMSESMIAQIPANMAHPAEYHACFISYSYPDRFFARLLHQALSSYGIRCWLDEHQIRRNVDFYEVVNREVRLQHKVILCCSQTALKSWWFKDEAEMAFRREREESNGLLLIPLTLDESFTSGDSLSDTAQKVRARLVANFAGTQHDAARFEDELNKIVGALRV